jgi:hypothetical protein
VGGKGPGTGWTVKKGSRKIQLDAEISSKTENYSLSKLACKKVHDMGTIRLHNVHQRLNVGYSNSDIIFRFWFCGLTDGDGTFWFGKKQNGSWDFCFKISQSGYNSKLLAYIKKV